MFRFTAILMAAGLAGAQPQAADVLSKVDRAYSTLTAIHVIATRVDSITRPGANGSSDREYEFAAQAPGKFRAWMKAGDSEALAVSDGSNTWKALPRAKQWMKVEEAAFGDDEDPNKDRTAPADFRGSISGMLVSRYPVIARRAEEPEIVREDEYRLNGAKVPCYVLRTHIKQTHYEFWIDKDRYLVLRDIQRSVQDTTSGPVKAAIDIKVKQIERNGEVKGSLFEFEPARKWVEVEALTLPEERPALLTGRPAIDFTLKSLEGDPLQLSSLRGKVVVLDFWATWCPPCRKELPILEKLRTEYGDRVQFIGVNDEDAGMVKGFRKSNGYQMAVLLDKKRDVAHEYGVRAIPTLLVIDAQGVVRQHWVGSRSESDLRKAIGAAGSGSEP